MISSLGLRISAIFRRTAPDPFVLAVLLTAVTFVLTLTLTDFTARQAVDAWSGQEGVWKFLAFSMQMCVILVTGHALAASRPVSMLLERLAGLPRSGAQAAALVAAVAAGLGVLNWGLGLVGGALLAREVGRSMARRGLPAHYPLLAAAGYVGLLVWHGGFSGTAPLKVSTAAQIADVLPAGVALEPILIDRTILSARNIIATGGMLLIAPVVFALMAPRGGQCQQATQFGVALRSAAPVDEDDREGRVVRLLEETPIVNWLLAGLILAWAWTYYVPGQGQPSGLYELTPDTVNLTMLMLGLVLHRSPRSYAAAVEDGARGCAGIILQFPLYAGIMGMMHASGLTARLAEWIAGGLTPATLPLMTFLSAGVVNLFVPSGGGQWGVQGPIAIESALATGVDPARMVMAVAYGDQVTNMLQPFWALPLLAITGCRARDIVGYTAIVMVVAVVWYGAVLVVP